MSSILEQLGIFQLHPLITNFSTKLSAVTEYNTHKQLLCLVSEDNDIVLRYTNESGAEVLKLVSWFHRTNRIIHDVCFDPSGTWLLVLCFDNTLHIVPALAIVDKTYADSEHNAENNVHQSHFCTSQVTSFIIPFVGPHECPDSKKCPNQQIEACNVIRKPLDKCLVNGPDTLAQGSAQDEELPDASNIANISHDVPSEMLMLTSAEESFKQFANNNDCNQMLGRSFMASNTCPYPLSVVWWDTLDGLHRAIIGYSDGSICFVGLSPHCPFVANTAIDKGSVVKLFICRDNTFDNVMLMITSSMKQQYKLLLEQTIIKYTYPGEIVTTPVQWDNDWQIVVSRKSSSNNLPELDNTTNNQENNDHNEISTEIAQLQIDQKFEEGTTIPTTTVITTSYEDVAIAPISTASQSLIVDQQREQISPPQLYLGEQVDCHPVNSNFMPTANVIDNKLHTQLFSEATSNGAIDETNGKAGILPAARARLASLKSLGSKKLNAIKMRLSDNKQKLEECMPECNFTSFTVMDSPSQIPELLTDSECSFYTLQNLRNTYLLSALHNHSNTLSVHNIDIHLKTLFQYKIPDDCIDILISSNILYAIQYVNIQENESIKSATNDKQDNSECKITETISTEKTNTTFNESVINLNNKPGKDLDSLKENERESDLKEASSTSNTVNKSPDKEEKQSNSNSINAVGVISSAMASSRTKDDGKFNTDSLLALFRFENETVLNLYQMATYSHSSTNTTTVLNEELGKNQSSCKPDNYKDIRSPLGYVQFYENADPDKEEYSLQQMEIMQNEFPKINYDPCYVITNKNVYYIQLKKDPFAIFLEAALAGKWTQCRQFCNTFDLNYESCTEFAGDYLLSRRKVTQALFTYNTARIKPIRTALKLAMYGQTTALIHLCAMALKLSYVLKSKRFCHPIIKTLLPDITYRHSEDVRDILPSKSILLEKDVLINEGVPCSDYKYGIDESLSNPQISPSSQFHLANLLLIALAEKAVDDKNYIPLWNFLVTNSKYHTNMTSIVLCQSGLFSAAVILAKMRGVCIDTFLALVTVVGQEFGWYNELNVCLYNLSDIIFTEAITYVPNIAIECFNFIQNKLKQIRPSVLQRLERQLNPFTAIWRPIVSHTSITHQSNESNTQLLEFCKNLIDTYLAVLIHMESQHDIYKDNIINALHTFRLTYEDSQFAIESSRFKPISAGCSHCACVVNGVAYFWGTNGVPCNYSVSKCADPPEPNYAVKSLELLRHLNLEIHAVKCGRQHTLLLTNNGLYSFGNNNLLQLGIGSEMQAALQPMLVKKLDGQNVTIVEAGQYHNAVVADGSLYTWGWGVYGQLGHGTIENVGEPKIVEFFKKKKILQISLGHAHSLVLCNKDETCTELYVFGSHHFGQLGLGASWDPTFNNFQNDISVANLLTKSKSNVESNCSTPCVKCVLPQKLIFTTAKIRLIHTKFFTNLAVDENDCLYTWGSSPQALRLANQIKRRANAKLKNEENQRREMNKWLSATPSINENLCKSVKTAVESAKAVQSLIDPSHTVLPIAAAIPPNGSEDKLSPLLTVSTETDEANHHVTSDDNLANFINSNTTTTAVTFTANDDILEEKKLLGQENDQENDNIDETLETNPTSTVSTTIACDVDNLTHMTPQQVDTSEIAGKILQMSTGLFHYALITSSCTLYTWGKNLEHQLGTEDKERRAVTKPSPLDNIEQPMHVECGADFTLVMTTDYLVKAFGSNSNGQCGRELGPSLDKLNKRLICMPASKRFMRYESQCVEVPVEINLPRPCIRLDPEPIRYLKSIPTYQPYFIQEADIDFNGNSNYDAVTLSPTTPKQHYKSTSVTGDSSSILTDDQDLNNDTMSSLENLSQNEVSSSSELPLNVPLLETTGDDLTEENNASSSGDEEATTEEQNYIRLLCGSIQRDKFIPLNKLCNTRTTLHRLPAPTSIILSTNTTNTTNATNATNSTNTTSSNSLSLNNNNDKDILAQADNICMYDTMQHLRLYIHYCLYIFHGLYNIKKIREFSSNRLEYRIRTLMLNFKFVDAFVMCLQGVQTPMHALKLFEYFAKDTGYVPLHRAQLRYLIYHLFIHFIEHKYDLIQCENFLLGDLDYYLLELAYVLYFNNNNTVLEQNLNEKFKRLIMNDNTSNEEYSSDGTNNINSQNTIILGNDYHNLNNTDGDGGLSMTPACVLNDTDLIFDNLSVKFKTMVCQYLLKHCNN